MPVRTFTKKNVNKKPLQHFSKWQLFNDIKSLLTIVAQMEIIVLDGIFQAINWFLILTALLVLLFSFFFIFYILSVGKVASELSSWILQQEPSNSPSKTLLCILLPSLWPALRSAWPAMCAEIPSTDDQLSQAQWECNNSLLIKMSHLHLSAVRLIVAL